MGQIIGPSAQQIIAQIVNGAPETLNTLNEIAAAIDDNGSYAASVQNALDAKAPLNSPTFTGNVSFTGANVSGISSYSAPTLGSTAIASGATVGTISGLTLSQPTIVGLGTGTVTGSITSGVMNTDIAETSLIIFGLSYTNESTLPQNGQQFYLTSGPVGYEGFITNPLVASNVSIAGGLYQATWTRVNDNSASRIAMIDMPLNAFQTITYTYTGSAPVNITPTEVGYLDGVTSNIQTQLNNKAGLSGATLTSTTLSGTTSVQQILEKATVSATAATGTINYDLLTNGAVTYYTSNASGNWTLNIRGNGSTTLNSLMSTGQSLTIAFLVTNGVTARYQTGFQIDGNAVSPRWQGGSAPTAGNASSIDIYSITIIKTGNAAFTALESQTRFA